MEPGGTGSSAPRILFPYNGSPTAQAALDVAAEWAHALHAEAWALYVRPCDVSRGGHYYLETRAEARALATEAAARLRGRGVSASGIVRDADRGRIAHAILAQADALDVRVIVLGTRARGNLRAALLGSPSRSVARRSTRSIVLVRAAVVNPRQGMVVRWTARADAGGRNAT
jgi:nucleotide-binding universal stress UspA family protein